MTNVAPFLQSFYRLAALRTSQSVRRVWLTRLQAVSVWRRQPLGTGGCLFFKRRPSRSRTDVKPAEDSGYFWRFWKYIGVVLGFVFVFFLNQRPCQRGHQRWTVRRANTVQLLLEWKKWFCSDTRKILWSAISKLEAKLLQQIVFHQISRSVVKLEAGGLRWDGLLSSWCLDYSRWWDATVQLTTSEVKRRLTAVVRQWGAVCWSELKRPKQSQLNQWDLYTDFTTDQNILRSSYRNISDMQALF